MQARCLATLSLILVASMVLAGNRPVGRSFVTRSEVLARHGMACTSQPLATQAALDILKAGGSAVDAAIAANALLGVVEPMSCGIGGDLFAIVWDAASGRLHGLNASGRSPRSLTLAMLRTNMADGKPIEKIPERGPLSVSVPGCVDGWFELHRKFGRLPMREVLAPAIRYAREGFPVSEVIANDWASSAAHVTNQPGFGAVYLPGGRAPLKGEVFRNPALAATLERLTAGRAGFYEGDTARIIESFLKTHGGFLTSGDLAAHRSEWVEPVSANYRGYDVWELPPNTQGIAALQMLNILEGFDLKRYGFGSVEHAHLFLEAKKLAFEDRARYYADPAFAKIPIRELISKRYAAERRKLIDPDRAAKSFDFGDPLLNHGDTVYLTTADGQGNMVSLIQSVYLGFGSGVCPDGLGFALQNRGALFNLKDGTFNTYAPGKRPFQTIIPAFITKDGRPWISFGVMGGQMQPQGHVQIVMNLIDFGMGLQEAGDAPRIQHNGSSEVTGTRMNDGGQVSLEFGFAPEMERGLVKRGHKVGRERAATFGGYQAILWDATNKVYWGASESRKDGQAAGY
ncbi:MAG TPA: gamma-glutamyltransferase [Methylomirabilota bacterium]|nr:gamma-glutamyltransferase [Methylomirabilota bacterium]